MNSPLMMACSALLSLLCLAPPCSAMVATATKKVPDPAFTRGVSAFKECQYSRALGEFRKRLAENPNDAECHYYAGLCYQSLSQIAAAETEYKYVWGHSQDGVLRYYSWKALADMKKWSENRAYKGNGNKFSYQPKGSHRRGANKR